MSRRNRLRRYFGGMLGNLVLGVGPGMRPSPGQTTQRPRHHDRRYRLGRSRRLRWRQNPQRADASPRPARGRRHDIHRMVRPGELHGRPRFIHHRTHPRALGALRGDRARRPKQTSAGDTDHRRVFQKERLPDLFLGKVASRRHHRRHAGQPWLRYDERFPRVLLRRLRVHGYQSSSGFSARRSEVHSGLLAKSE